MIVLNKEKALVGAFSGHCETSRRFVASSTAVTQILDLLHKIFHHHDDVGSLLTSDRWIRERSEIHDRGDDVAVQGHARHNLVQIFIDVLYAK